MTTQQTSKRRSYVHSVRLSRHEHVYTRINHSRVDFIQPQMSGELNVSLTSAAECVILSFQTWSLECCRDCARRVRSGHNAASTQPRPRRHRSNANRTDARLSVASTRRPGPHAARRSSTPVTRRTRRPAIRPRPRAHRGTGQDVLADRYGLQRKNFRMPKRVWRRINICATRGAETLQPAN